MEKNLLNLSYGFNIILLLKIKQVNLSFFFGVLFTVYSLFIQCEFSLQMKKGACETQVGWRVWDPQEMVCPAIPTTALQKRRPGTARS